MMTKKLVCLLALFLLFSCEKKEEETKATLQPEPEIIETSALSVTPKSFADLKNWSKDDVSAAVEAFKLSCPKIMLENNQYMSNSKIKIPTQAYKDICTRLPMFKPAEYRKFLEENFVPYAVSYDGRDSGKFTAYYEALIYASYTKSSNYPYPIYSRPLDLLEVNLKDFDPELPDKRIVGRLVGQKLVPYYTREQISNNQVRLRSTPILYSNSELDIYIMQIQGSAVAKLDDGSQIRISYADSNGLPFKGIGSILLENRVLRPDEVSMINIKNWLRSNAGVAKNYMNQNQRYIFHRLSNESGPIGAQGVPLTAGRSLAVDRDYVPLGAMLWLETFLPDKGKIGKLMVAQDVGSAIKGPIRGDYFWGSGDDSVLAMAGKMNSGGRYFILVPKTAEAKI